MLLVVGCGSGDSQGDSSGLTPPGSAVPNSDESEAAGSDSGADSEVAAYLASDEVAEADQLATIAIDAFGSPEAAMDAVLFALDAGYAGEQIEAALRAGTLQQSGFIDGVDPAFPPTDLVVGFRRSSPEPLPVERLRMAATDEAAQLGLVEPGGASGRNGLQLLLLLVGKGIPPEAIVEALILGFEWPWELDTELPACPADAVSAVPIVVAGTVYPPLGCGEPYPLPDDAPDEIADPDIGVDDADDPPGEMVDLSGSLTGGPTIEGTAPGSTPFVYPPVAVTENAMQFTLDFDVNFIGGDATVIKEVDNSSGDCTSRRVLELGYVFSGSFVDEEQMLARGTVKWGAVDVIVLELEGTGGQCDAGPGRFGELNQEGTWEATWDATTGVLRGTMRTAAGADSFEANTGD